MQMPDQKDNIPHRVCTHTKAHLDSGSVIVFGSLSVTLHLLKAVSIGIYTVCFIASNWKHYLNAHSDISCNHLPALHTELR